LPQPFFLWLKADVQIQPVMRLRELGKAGLSIGVAVKTWG
jgi:hypothetical protein